MCVQIIKQKLKFVSTFVVKTAIKYENIYSTLGKYYNKMAWYKSFNEQVWLLDNKATQFSLNNTRW